MSLVLAIETSVPNASIALLREGRVTELNFVSHRRQNQLLFPPLQELLDAAKDPIDTVLIGTGPGSYSGSRIAIAAAHGIASVHGSKLAGICSFYACEQSKLANSVAVGDARRDTYFIHHLDPSDLFPKPSLHSKESFIAELKKQGDTNIFSFETRTEIPYPKVILTRPTAHGLIQFWNKLTAEQQIRLSKKPLEPLYLRDPFITKSRKKHPLL